MKMLLGLSEALPSLVEAKYKAAKATSGLKFSPTELAIVRTSSGIPFQLRFCPTLAKKPVPKAPDATPKQKIDVFANPSPALHVVDIPTTNPSHFLVLNKFPVIAEHFILATKSNKPQNHLLEQDDLEATYACLKAWQEGSGSTQKRLFAFFNSGDHSGASQPHRHLQFLPLESMSDSETAGSWNLLADLILSSSEVATGDPPPGLLQHPDLPVVHFAWAFDDEPSGSQLLSIYTELYKVAKEAVHDFVVANPTQLTLHPKNGGSLPISYNLAITTTGMVIFPRRSEGSTLRNEDGSDGGFVALNGTTLAGTIMVKHEAEWDLLRKKPEMLDMVLTTIGIPRDSSRLKSHV